MSFTNDSFNDHDRVVFSALQRMTEDRNTISMAFHFWRQNLSSKTFNIEILVSELVKFLALGSDEKKRLMIGLHLASGKSTNELEELPGYLIGGSNLQKTNNSTEQDLRSRDYSK